MSRWTVFDDATAAAAKERGAEARLRPADSVAEAVAEAFRGQRPTIAVFPGDRSGQAVVLRIERPTRSATANPQAAERKGDPKVSYAATGFLGLTDEIVTEESEPPAPKKWWQKILD